VARRGTRGGSTTRTRHTDPHALTYVSIIVPEVVIALSTLVLFASTFGIINDATGMRLQLGIPTIIAAQMLFDISIVLLLVATGLFLMTTIGIGLFISTVASTQQQAMMTAFFFFFPAVLLSGFMFPIANMPVPVQWLTIVNPLRYFLIIIRGIFLKGVGVSVLWPELLALFILGIITLTVSTRAFRKTLS